MTGHEVDERCAAARAARVSPTTVERGRVCERASRTWSTRRSTCSSTRSSRCATRASSAASSCSSRRTSPRRPPENERRNLDYLEYVADKLRRLPDAGGVPAPVVGRRPSTADAHARVPRGPRAGLRLRRHRRSSPTRSHDAAAARRSRRDWAYVRFHGRNAETWLQAHGDRRRPLRLPVHRPRSCASGSRRSGSWPRDADETFVMFNNNKYDYAQRNAAEIATILGDLVPPRRRRGGLEPSLS